ncbi:unnamed protein product [Mucor hiemalis]
MTEPVALASAKHHHPFFHHLRKNTKKSYKYNNRKSKIEEQPVPPTQPFTEGDNDHPLIQVPWDDDQFSLCLENFPNAKWASKFFPTTKSPLRNHWKNEEISDQDDEEAEEGASPNKTKEKEESSISLTSTSTSSISDSVKNVSLTDANGSTINDRKTKKKRKSKISIFFNKKDINSNSSFPYNNDTNFLNRIEEECVPVVKEVPQQRGRVEHVSPLFNNPALSDSLMQGLPIVSSLGKIPSARSSIKSKRPSISSHPSQVSESFSEHGGSINGQSVVSESGTVESWKMARGSIHKGLNSPTLLPGPRQQYNPTPSREYYQFQHSPSLSGTATPSTITSSGAMTPLQQPLYYSHSVRSGYSNNSTHYYAHPSPIAGHNSQASSFRSVQVPKNADDLVFFSPTPSLYSVDVGSEYSERSRSYSQYFNPSYKVSGHKKKKGAKRSNTMLSRLVKNIKHHFTKQQPQEH